MTHWKHLVVALVAAFVLAGCSSSNNGGTASTETPASTPESDPPSYMVDLMGSPDLGDGMTTIAAGDSVMVGDTTVSCPDGGPNCVLNVLSDPVTGVQTATSTGGAAMVAYNPADPAPKPPSPTVVEVPSGNSLRAALANADQRTLVIAPGGHVDFAGVRWSCPEGGSTCVVEFSDDINPTATTGGPDSGTATAGRIPNPTFGGSNLAGYLSNANILEALNSGGLATRSFDVNGDGTGDFQADTTTAPQPTAIGTFDAIGRLGYENEAIVLYSDIDADVNTAFTEVYGDAVTSSRADFWSKIGGTVTAGNYRADSSPITTATFDGAAGTLVCQLTPCTISVAGVTSGTGSWQFTPGDAVTVPVRDKDYVTFGWWSKGEGDLNVALQSDVLWAGSDSYMSEHVGQLEGTATYTGGAAGRYEDRDHNAQTPSRTVTRGPFTGTVSLTADFDVDRIAGSVTITDAATLNLPTTVTLRSGPISGNAFGGGVDWSDASSPSGSWRGQFFGNGKAPDQSPGAFPAPTHVAGEFTAWSGGASGTGNYTNLHGAFGASETSP